MQYMLFIYDQESDWNKMTDAEKGKIFGEYRTFTEEIKKEDKYRAGSGLQATTTATTVRVRDGKTMKTHGPFAETREQLGGYYLIEAMDLDDACAIAARIPSARFGSIEIRPLMTGPSEPSRFQS